MCLLADLWISALSEAGCSASVLLLVRHPQEVADSLAARDGMATARAHLLWARHVLAAERSSRGLPRLVLTYDQLRSEEHTSELQSLMLNSYAVFCFKKNKK